MTKRTFTQRLGTAVLPVAMAVSPSAQGIARMDSDSAMRFGNEPAQSADSMTMDKFLNNIPQGACRAAVFPTSNNTMIIACPRGGAATVSDVIANLGDDSISQANFYFQAESEWNQSAIKVSTLKLLSEELEKADINPEKVLIVSGQKQMLQAMPSHGEIFVLINIPTIQDLSADEIAKGIKRILEQNPSRQR